MTTNKRIKKALNLNQETDEIHRYYDEWSTDYDQDVAAEHYSGPELIAGIASSLYKDENGVASTERRSRARVLDAGCGTGLAGVALAKHGFRRLVGVDLSPNMIAQARHTNAYQTLCAEIDLTLPVASQIAASSKLPESETDQFDITTCVGVFTLGHVPPRALYSLLDVTRPGGLVLLTVRQEYCDKYKFGDLCNQLQKEERVNIEYSQWSDYVSNDRALYIALRPLH